MKEHKYVLLIPVLILIVFYNSLNGTWAMDDAYISSYTTVKNYIDLKLDFRKISYITFQLNSILTPNDVFYYRLVNVFLHCLNTLLLYFISFITFSRFIEVKNPVISSLAVAIIYALHPINNTSVVYVIQRMSLLSTFFVLLSLLTYIKSSLTDNKIYSYILKVIVCLLIFLGVLSKENAVLAIPLIFLFDFTFIKNDKDYLKKLIFMSLGLFIFGVVFLYLLGFTHTITSIINIFLSPNEVIRQEGWTSIDVYWTPFQHLLTETRVIMTYLISIVIPIPQNFVFDWWGFPISESLFQPISTVLSVSVVIFLTVFAFIFKKRYPYLSFAIFWYLIGLSLESFVAIGSDLYFEHRNYLPFGGLLIGILGHNASHINFKDKKVLLCLSVFILLLIFTTIKRNECFRDSITLWKDTIDKAPNNLRAKMSLGNAYLKEFKIMEAINTFDSVLSNEMIKHSPTFLLDALFSKGMVNVYVGKLTVSEEALRLMETNPYKSIKAMLLKSAIDISRDKHDEALLTLNQVLPQLKGNDLLNGYILLADAYRAKGDIDKSIQTYSSVIQLDPQNSTAYYGIGKSYLSVGQKDSAIKYLMKCLELEQKNIFALTDLSDIYLINKDIQKAFEYADRAVKLNIPFYKSYLAMANVMLLKGSKQEAENWYKKSLDLNAPPYLIPFNKSRVYMIKDDDNLAVKYLKETISHKGIPNMMKGKIDAYLKRR